MLSGILENYDERHIQRIDRDIEKKGGKRNEIDVEMITLNSIKSLNNQPIDFISIDTEGNEFDIVLSMNFTDLDVKASSLKTIIKTTESGIFFLNLILFSFIN